jgi:hypothetical protein
VIVSKHYSTIAFLMMNRVVIEAAGVALNKSGQPYASPEKAPAWCVGPQINQYSDSGITLFGMPRVFSFVPSHCSGSIASVM